MFYGEFAYQDEQFWLELRHRELSTAQAAAEALVRGAKIAGRQLKLTDLRLSRPPEAAVLTTEQAAELITSHQLTNSSFASTSFASTGEEQ